jgi:hypothetical protein
MIEFVQCFASSITISLNLRPGFRLLAFGIFQNGRLLLVRHPEILQIIQDFVDSVSDAETKYQESLMMFVAS